MRRNNSMGSADVYVVNGLPLPDGFLDGIFAQYNGVVTWRTASSARAPLGFAASPAWCFRRELHRRENRARRHRRSAHRPVRGS
ncbi:MAG: hypothetical protein CM1200mP34_1980 [Verrucomicrobiales bacterium]|nr:MAG: hypothetical protein CM1200mP34_1980 [Verrucomicrobiales bacterium]